MQICILCIYLFILIFIYISLYNSISVFRAKLRFHKYTHVGLSSAGPALCSPLLGGLHPGVPHDPGGDYWDHDLRRCSNGNMFVKWWFPKIGIPPVIIHFSRIFHEINHPLWGNPKNWETSIFHETGTMSNGMFQRLG